MSLYDYIVVGSGSAGAVITRRLVDAGARVLLLEAGGPDSNPNIHEPSGLFNLWLTDEDWGYFTVAQKYCHNRQLHWPRGKVLGGSSGLNGMIYVRGNPQDYDTWASLGNYGWSYDEVLPYFKKSEDFDGGASHYHGVGGPLRVISQFTPHPVTAAFVAAAQETGLAYNPDCNAETQDGVGYCHLTIKDGQRHSTAEAFLRPVESQPNLTIATRARARRLLFEGPRCVGVEYAQGGRLERAEASIEVIVSAGTLESPKLLMLSGIGQGDALRRLGLTVVSDLPGVGQNLHDHMLVPIIHAAKRPLPPPMPGLQQLHGQLFARSKPGLATPDTQPLFFHLPLYAPDMQGPADGYTLMAGMIRPASRGYLAITSAEPDAEMVIDPDYFSQDADMEAMLFSVEQCREILQAEALGEWRDQELYPGPHLRTREQLRDYIRAQAVTYHHQVGTCKMGVDAEAVVDPELRVYGVSGLRVADASIMPLVTSGNTHAPAVMIGEKAADLLLATQSMRPHLAAEQA
jgi:choline dehydrogenase